MMTPDVVVTLKTGRAGNGIVPLLALLIFLNYVDRGSLNITAPLIKDQLHFTSTQIGLLLSAFFWSYVPAQILTGWLAQLYRTDRVIAVGLMVWAMATAGMGMATGFISFLICRLLLGVGESVAFPCSSKLLAQYVPQERLGRANGLIAVGMALGPGFGTLIGGLLMVQHDWRFVYLLFGFGSLLWLLPWHWATQSVAASDPAANSRLTPTWLQLLRCRDLWGATLGHFCANYAFYFILAWLPLYLVKDRGMTLENMAHLGGFIYITYAASAFATGLLTDRLIRSGISINRVRKSCMNGSLIGIAFCLGLVGVGDAPVSMAGLLLVGIAMGMCTPNIYAISQTLAGPHVAGKWVGIQNSLANIAGIVAPVVTGYLVDVSGHYQAAFLIAAGLSLIGVIGYAVIVRKVAPVNWKVELGVVLA